jgi:hypothetical protein
MNGLLICAATDCDNTFERHPGALGRPQIYCCPTCRPSYSRPSLAVALDRDDNEDEHRSARDWMVSLRRGEQSVVIASGLGRFSATALAAELRAVVGGRGSSIARRKGDTIE